MIKDMKTVTVTITTSHNAEKNIEDSGTIMSYNIIIIYWPYVEYK